MESDQCPARTTLCNYLFAGFMLQSITFTTTNPKSPAIVIILRKTGIQTLCHEFYSTNLNSEREIFLLVGLYQCIAWVARQVK